jgi:rubrerythrin
MDFVKAKEILDAVHQMDPNSKESILKALSLAEHIESTSMMFYSKEADKTKGSELEPFFKFMVAEEEMHLIKILELRKVLEAGDDIHINFEKHDAPPIHSIKGGQEEMTALLFALWREKKAAEFYAGAAEKSKGSVKEFFEELAEFEREHVHLFEEYVESMQNADELIMG